MDMHGQTKTHMACEVWVNKLWDIQTLMLKQT
jgi:hypothetical protein